MAEMQLPAANAQMDGQFVPGANFLKGAVGMPVVRQMTLMIALAASVAVAVFAIFWMQGPDYRPIGGATSPAETNEIVNVLESNQMSYKLDQRSGMVLVPADEIYSARMMLAGAEVLDGRQLGYELLDKEQGFGVSQFMEIAKHRRSVEGELARSIATITSVMQARVLLATPKSTSFLRDRRKPSASVTVTLKPGRRLTSDQVSGITNLVAAAVPELKSADVVVVDQSGSLLSNGRQDAALQRSEKDLALARTIELSLHEKVSNILGPWVGVDRFTAEVSASVDFTRAEQTEESYNPELAALRSEQVMEEQQVGVDNAVGGVPGTLSNQPPEFNEAESEAEETPGRRSQSTRATRNYEVDRTISHTQYQVGRLQRLSVAVVVDHRPVVDAESGETSLEPWAEEDLNELTQAVQSAVGFDQERGDTVSVVNRAFYREPVSELAPTPFWETGWFSDIVKQVLGGLAILLVVFGLLRPMYKNLSQAGDMVREQQSMAIADMTQMREAALQEAVPGLPATITTDPDDSATQKMETVRNLIGEDPARVAQVVKHWVGDNE
ncbi:MAG: flagellar basal-body MS-ring/collar protein FliF [Pseudomonadota bacterium]